MSTRNWLLATCTALALTACQQAEAPAPAEPTTPAKQAEEEATEPEAPAAEEEVAQPEATGPTADNVPIAEDFAEQVAEDVTEANYEDALAAMEKELAE